MKIKPLKNRVLIKPDKVDSKTPGGIIIPENAKEKTQIGTVTCIGESELSGTVSVGQRVMYEKYTGIPIKDGEDDYLIVKLADLIAVIE